MTDSLGQYVTVQKASELTGYTPYWIRVKCREGVIRSKKIGKIWFVHRQSALEYKEKMNRLGTDKHIG